MRGPGTLSTSLAEQLVNGVIDGTYPHVRAIAVYHKGGLRLEEYFYGYDRDRPHQMRSLTKSVITLLAGVAVDRSLFASQRARAGPIGLCGVPVSGRAQGRVTPTHLLSNQSGLLRRPRWGIARQRGEDLRKQPTG